MIVTYHRYIYYTIHFLVSFKFNPWHKKGQMLHIVVAYWLFISGCLTRILLELFLLDQTKLRTNIISIDQIHQIPSINNSKPVMTIINIDNHGN